MLASSLRRKSVSLLGKNREGWSRGWRREIVNPFCKKGAECTFGKSIEIVSSMGEKGKVSSPVQMERGVSHIKENGESSSGIKNRRSGKETSPGQTVVPQCYHRWQS